MYQLIFVLFILVFCLVPTVGLQAVVVRGTVVDGATDKSLPNITVKLLNSRVGTSTNIYGHFQINAISTDSLQFSSVGYETRYRQVGANDTILVTLYPKLYHLNPFNVLAKNRVPPECQSTVYPSGEPSLFCAIYQPISFWYYVLNRQERAKRKYRKKFKVDKKMAKVFALYSSQLVSEYLTYSGLTGKALDSCIMYCNAHIELNADDTEFIVKHKLLQVMTKYLRARKE